MRNPLGDLQANISNKVATLAHEVTHLPRLNQLLKIHRYTVNDDMAKLVLVLRTALSIFERVSYHLYYIRRSMTEVFEALERTLKVYGREVHELLDVVLICKDVESSMNQNLSAYSALGPWSESLSWFIWNRPTTVVLEACLVSSGTVSSSSAILHAFFRSFFVFVLLVLKAK